MSTSRSDLARNIRAFERMEDDLIRDHSGEYALLYDEELVRTYLDKESARIAAARRFPNGGFAISPPIGAPPASLGVLGLHVKPSSLAEV